MRAMIFAAALVAAASFSGHAAECITVEAARGMILEDGGVYLGVAAADAIVEPRILGAEQVITAIISGSLYRIPVDGAGCAAEAGVPAAPDVEA